jgi:hypothetical protein
MDPDDYYVRVQVDGEPIPLDYHCNRNPFHRSCRFTVSYNITMAEILFTVGRI